MSKKFSPQLSFIVNRPWFRALATLWVLVEFFDTVGSQLLPDTFRLPKFFEILSNWWGAGAVVLLFLGFLEFYARRKTATDNQQLHYLRNGGNVQVLEPSSRESNKNYAFIKFRPESLEIIDGENISSLADYGVGDFGVVFSDSFCGDDIKSFVLGVPPKGFQFTSVNASAARFTFDETGNPLVSLRFEI